MTVRSERVARWAQFMIAAPFLILGPWCIVFPGQVESLGLLPEHYIGTDASRVLLGCFGAQAVLSGLFAAFSQFTRITFLAYGLALLPFFWFNVRFTLVNPIFSKLMLIDFLANVLMLGFCVIGWRALAPLDGQAARQVT